jgi:NitT/TauT family transport system substrate-binding protein
MEKFRWESIKGKTLIGRYRASTPGLFLDFALRNRGIDPSGDIKLRADIAVPVRARIWRSGVGDFATFYEPQVTRLEQEGKGFPVASIGKEVGSVDFTVFIATETYLEKHPAVVQGWVNAVQKSLSWTTRTTPKEIASLVAHYFRRADEATLTRAIERYMSIDLWKTDPTISRKSVADLQSMMIESRVIDSDRRVAYERIVEPRFAEQAHRSAGSRD